jgi:hypothetical protein
LPQTLFFDTPLSLKETFLLPLENNVLLYETTVLPKEIIKFLKENEKLLMGDSKILLVFSVIGKVEAQFCRR